MLRVRGGVGRVGKEAGGERGECGRKMGLGELRGSVVVKPGANEDVVMWV